LSDPLEFFLVSLPGLEDVLQKEIADWFPELTGERVHGGVTLFAPLEIGLGMNLVLKTPTRILLRVASFTCRDFPKLFRKVSALPWDQWLGPGCELQVRAASHTSRLKIKKRIEETCLDAWKKRGKPSGESSATLMVRLNDDVCTLSLDTSGERLHKRGVRQNVGLAPLRENLAASMLLLIGQHCSSAQPVELIDPMMGSAGLLCEGGLRDSVIDQREFAFSSWQRPQIEVPKLQATRAPIVRLLGYERDERTVRAARQNFKNLKWSGELETFAEDFFAAKPLAPVAAGRQRWVVVNPPYGERLKVEQPLKEFYADLFRTTEQVLRPDFSCFLLPQKASAQLSLPVSWKVLEKRRFSNGGIPVVAFVFGRKSVESPTQI
jgi:putative N6-adenine-specific DNA methylase